MAAEGTKFDKSKIEGKKIIWIMGKYTSQILNLFYYKTYPPFHKIYSVLINLKIQAGLVVDEEQYVTNLKTSFNSNT